MSFSPKINFVYNAGFKDKQGVSKIDADAKKATPPDLEKRREKPDSKYDPHSQDYDRATAKTRDQVNCVAKFTQGVSAKNKKPSGNRVLPLMGTGLDDNIVEVLNYGQPQEFKANEAFEDIASFSKSSIGANKVADTSAIDFINSGDKQTYALNLINKAHDDPSQFDGVIEAMTIREVLSNTSIESPVIAKSVKGVVSDGNIDTLGKSSNVTNLLPFATSSAPNAFLDGGERMADIFIPTAVWEKEENGEPFDETQSSKRNINTQMLLLSASSDMISAIAALNPQTEQYPPAGFKSSRTGFIFNNGALGVDSIAFGNLRKDA